MKFKNIKNIKKAVIAVCIILSCICYGFKRNWKFITVQWNVFSRSHISEEVEVLSSDMEKLSDFEQVNQETDWEEETFIKICYVHICGEVLSPGVYEVAEGSRIYEVVEMAGGFSEQAASDYLNLATTIEDGMKLVVPSMKDLEEGTLITGVMAEIQDGQSGKVNINTASKEELMSLRGIGEAKAEDIIRFREENGSFKAIEDIKRISGIKEAAFEKIKDNITV